VSDAPRQPLDVAAAEEGISPTRLFLRRLRRSKVALIGGAILVVFYLTALFGSFVSPYTPTSSDRRQPFHPPTRIHFFDVEGHFHLRPFIYHYRMVDPDLRRYAPDTSVRYPLVLFPRGESYRLWDLIPMDRHLFGVVGDTRVYLLGSDFTGRDLFTRLIAGGKVSLSIGLIGIAITITLGLIVGGISGHFGGWIDTVLMRFVELLLSIPALYLILALRAALPDNITSTQRYLLIVMILGFIGWAATARVIRGMVLSLREREYVLASRALGAGPWRLIVRHLLPNTFTYVIVAATIAVPGYILGEVALSFLGFGIEEPQTSWGLMLRDAQDPDLMLRHPWIVAPGIAIFVTVLAFNFLGDGLRDALDPHAKR
jgi:peptide/nickel transport system permease protein